MSFDELLRRLKDKFGENARIKIFCDGSGHICKTFDDERLGIEIDFHDLYELKNLLPDIKPLTNTMP